MCQVIFRQTTKTRTPVSIDGKNIALVNNSLRPQQFVNTGLTQKNRSTPKIRGRLVLPHAQRLLQGLGQLRKAFDVRKQSGSARAAGERFSRCQSAQFIL